MVSIRQKGKSYNLSNSCLVFKNIALCDKWYTLFALCTLCSIPKGLMKRESEETKLLVFFRQHLVSNLFLLCLYVLIYSWSGVHSLKWEESWDMSWLTTTSDRPKVILCDLQHQNNNNNNKNPNWNRVDCQSSERRSKQTKTHTQHVQEDKDKALHSVIVCVK